MMDSLATGRASLMLRNALLIHVKSKARHDQQGPSNAEHRPKHLPLTRQSVMQPGLVVNETKQDVARLLPLPLGSSWAETAARLSTAPAAVSPGAAGSAGPPPGLAPTNRESPPQNGRQKSLPRGPRGRRRPMKTHQRAGRHAR